MNSIFYMYRLNPDGSEGEYLGRISTHNEAGALAALSHYKGIPAHQLLAKPLPSRS